MSLASPGSFSVPWSDSDIPSLNAQCFKEMAVRKVRENLLTESSTREPVRLVGEEMDGIAHEQHRRRDHKGGASSPAKICPVENTHHWVMAVALGEDDSRIRTSRPQHGHPQRMVHNWLWQD